MNTMNISLPEPLKNFVDERVANAGYGTSSEYLRELIRRNQDRLHLRSMLLDGAKAPMMGEVDAQYFANLRIETSKRLQSVSQ
jgi:antitoxin ParD1/3/4